MRGAINPNKIAPSVDTPIQSFSSDIVNLLHNNHRTIIANFLLLINY